MARFRKSARLRLEHLEDRRVLSPVAIGLDLPRPFLELSFPGIRAGFDVPARVNPETTLVRVHGHGEHNNDNPKHDEPANITADPIRVSIVLTPRASVPADAVAAPAEAAPQGVGSISLPSFPTVPAIAAPVGVPPAPMATLADEPRVLSQAASARDIGARWFGNHVSADGQETRGVRATETPSLSGVLPTPRATRDSGLADELTLLQTPPDVLAPADHDANLGLAIEQFLQQLDDLGREVARALSESGGWTWVAAGALGAAGLEMMRRRLRRQALAAAVGGDEDVSLTSVPGLPGPFSSEQP